MATQAQRDKRRQTRNGTAAALTGPPVSGGYEPSYHTWGTRPRDLPPFTFQTIQAMLMDPTVRLGLAMRAAPLFGVEFGKKQGDEWVEGVQCKNEAVGAFVHRQLLRIWSELDRIVSSQIWGWSAGEITYKLTDDNTVEIDALLPRHSTDCRALTRGGEPVGVQIKRVQPHGVVDVYFPQSWWHSYNPPPGRLYGESALLGAYSPWADKWLNGGALDVRRLFMHKDAYGGADLAYPDGQMNIPGKGMVPCRDIAREIVEQIQAGGVTTRPSGTDANGVEMWKLTRATVPAAPTHILEYPKDLDGEILRGLEITDDVISADGTGSWAGKRVPMAAFYNSLDRWVVSIIRDITPILQQLVVLNYGESVDFSIDHKPLAEQAMEQQGDAGQDDQQKPSSPFDDHFYGEPDGELRMSLEVKNGRVIRMRRTSDDNPWQSYRGPRGGKGWRHSGTGDIRYGGDRPGKDEIGTGESPKNDATLKNAKEPSKEDKFEVLMQSKTPADADAFRRARADGIMIPPAWTEVTYYGADNDIRAEGRDDKGRKQRAENPEFRKRVSDENNARIARDLAPNMNEIRDRLRNDAIDGNEEAKVLYLIAQSGFRIGGKGDGKAKVQAFGATTLLGEHVSVDGNTVTFDFLGKKGVRQHHVIEDKVIADMVRDAKDGEPIFNTRAEKVRQAWQETYGGAKVHDIRHVVATEIAKNEMESRVPPLPHNDRERTKLIKEIAKASGEKLGNNPSQALGTYIDPGLWNQLKVAA